MVPNPSVATPPSPQDSKSAGKKNMYEALGLDPENNKDSVTFFGYSLLLGTATILQSRKIFATNTYKRKSIPGLCRVMAINTETEIGARMTRRIKSAFRTMTHGYLKEFIIVVSKVGDSPHDAIEVFTWRFSYNSGDISASFISDESDPVEITFKDDVPLPAQLKDFLMRLRQMCRQVMQPLPKDAYATFKLVNTDDVPDDYTSEGYRSAPVLYNLDPAACSAVVGTLGNQFLKSAVMVKSVYIDDGVVATRMLDGLMGHDDSMLNVTIEAVPETKPKRKRGETIGKVHDLSQTISPDGGAKRRTEVEDVGAKKRREEMPRRSTKSRTPGRTNVALSP